MQTATASCANTLLAALPAEDFDRLEPDMRHTELSLGEVLNGGTRGPDTAYFPTTALVSILCTTASGESLDVAITGADGLVGLPFPWPNAWTPGLAVVQRGGDALRLPLAVVRREFARGGALQQQVLRYTQFLMTQIAQTALCMRLHRLDQQLCRWILMTIDRCGTDRLQVTQQQVALILGVRREGVSVAVGRLEAAGILHWGRGRLRVLDRAAMESQACECYMTLRSASNQLFGVKPPGR